MTTQSFADLGVPAPLAHALEKNGKSAPFPIQRDTLPDTLKGRDVLGRGRTGSGKTIAFAIPLVANLAIDADKKRRPNRPRGIVLAPTRELVTQIAETVKMLADPVGVRVTTVFGGVPQRRQEAVLERGLPVGGNADDAMAALDAADAVQADWAATPPRERGEILRRAFEAIHASADDFAELLDFLQDCRFAL